MAKNSLKAETVTMHQDRQHWVSHMTNMKVQQYV